MKNKEEFDFSHERDLLMMERPSATFVASDTSCTHIMKNLPIFISSEDAEKYSSFILLLEDLCKHLHSNGALKTTHSKFNQVTLLLKYARHKYIYYKLLDMLCKDILFRRNKNAGSSRDIKQLSALCETFTLTQVLDQVILNSTTESETKPAKLFGIEPDRVSAKVEVSSCRNDNRALISLLKPQLESDWTKLLHFINPSTDEVPQISVIETVADNLLQKKQQLTTEQDRLRSVEMSLDKALLQGYLVLVEYETVLHRVLLKRRLTQYHTKYLMPASCILQGYLLKLKSVELQLMCSNYTPETIPALWHLKRRLDGAIENTTKELNLVKLKLARYEGLDDSYLSLVEEYNALSGDIEFFKKAEK